MTEVRGKGGERLGVLGDKGRGRLQSLRLVGPELFQRGNFFVLSLKLDN